MSDILLPPSSGSCLSAALTSCLASRLQLRLATAGSTMYRQSWRGMATDSGRRYLQLVSSVPRTGAKDFTSAQWTGWLSPVVNSIDERSPEALERRSAQRAATGRQSLSPGNLAEQARWYAGWATPTVRDHKDGRECVNVPINSLLGRVVWLCDQPIRLTDSGLVLTGSDAGMESSGRLNPEHSRWLMGFPPVWSSCGVLATRLCPSSLPSS